MLNSALKIRRGQGLGLHLALVGRHQAAWCSGHTTPLTTPPPAAPATRQPNNPSHAIPPPILTPAHIHYRLEIRPNAPKDCAHFDNIKEEGGACQQPKRNCYLHRVGVPETVLVAVVELLHVAEGLEGHVKNRERGRPPPHLLLPHQPLVSLPASSFSSKVLIPASEAGHHLAVAHLGTHLTISHPLSPPRHPVTAPPVLSWTMLEKDFSDWAPQLCPKLNLPMPPICRARDALILFTSHPRTTWEPTIFNQRWQRSFQTVFQSLSLGATRDSLLWGRQRKSWCHHSSRAIVSW